MDRSDSKEKFNITQQQMFYSEACLIDSFHHESVKIILVVMFSSDVMKWKISRSDCVSA